MAKSDETEPLAPKPVFWVGSSRRDIRWLPKPVRAVYTIRFAGAVYVLHVFQKKSKTGRKTPPGDIERVAARLKEAVKHHAEWARQQTQENRDS